MKKLLFIFGIFISLSALGQKGDSIRIYACDAVLNNQVITAPMKEPFPYLTFNDSTMLWHSPGGEDIAYHIKKKVTKDYFLVSDGIEEYVVNIYVLDTRASVYDFLSGKRIDYYTVITFKQNGVIAERYYCSPIYHEW